MLWNRRVYYDKNTGEVITVTGGFVGLPTRYTVEYEFQIYPVLKERARETIETIDLEVGQYDSDFIEAIGYRVNLATKTLEFSYPDPNEPETPPTYKEPLSVSVEGLLIENEMLQASVMELSAYAASQDERLQIQENAVMELSMIVAGGV